MWATSIADECLTSLSNEDESMLRDDLVQMGEEGWWAWVHENREAINSFLIATPIQRQKKKAWADRRLWSRLAFAAHREARLAAAFLAERERIYPGGSYRSTCSQAAAAARSVCQHLSWRWPFADPPPFPEWE